MSFVRTAGGKSSTGSLFVPTGLESFDAILKGGFPVGTITIVGEDQHGGFSNCFCRVLASANAFSKRKVLIFSPDPLVERNFVANFPRRVKKPSLKQVEAKDLKIAWKYAGSGDVADSFYYSLQLQCDFDSLERPEVLIPSVGALVELEERLKAESDLHVVLLLHGFGGCFWSKDIDLIKFLFRVRRIVKAFSGRCSAVVPAPAFEISEPALFQKVCHLGDSVIEFKEVESTGRRTVGCDRKCKLVVRRLASSSSSPVPLAVPSRVLAATLGRRELTISLLHLPPVGDGSEATTA